MTDTIRIISEQIPGPPGPTIATATAVAAVTRGLAFVTVAGGVRVADTAGLAINPVPSGLIITTVAANETTTVQTSGITSASITGLPAGTACPVGLDATGALVRQGTVGIVSGFYVGDTNTSGDVTWNYRSTSGGAGGPPFGTDCTNTGADAFAGGLRATADGAAAFAYGTDVAATADQSVALGRDALATGVGALAIGLSHGVGLTCRAEGEGSQAIGLDCVAEQTYSVAIGAHCLSRSSASVAIGEILTAGGVGGASGQNAVVVGFGSQALGTYSSAFGTQCYALGFGSHAHGYACSAVMCGEDAHGGGVGESGSRSTQGKRAIDMGADINATAGDLKMRDDSEIEFRANSINIVTIQAEATVVGQAFNGSTKIACETIQLLVRVVGTVATIVGSPTWTAVGQSFASMGWTIGLSTIYSGIRISANAGSDHIYAFARVQFSEISGIA